MAKKKHLRMLKEALKRGNIGIWNRWREDNPGVAPSLRKAKLKGAVLKGANLRKADLREASILAICTYD